jgi:hypothetical protein
MNHLMSKTAAAFRSGWPAFSPAWAAFRPGLSALFIGLSVFLIALSALSWIPAAAQESEPVQDTNKAIQLPPGQLKAFEGYFQFSQSKDQVIQVKIVRDTLVAKLLWNGVAIHIVPESDSVFHNVEPVEGRTIPIMFSRNSEGNYSSMYLFDKQRPWNRIKDYKPLVRTEIPHTPAQLKKFEGIYRARGNESYIGISEKENKLVLHQFWDGNEIEFVPDSALTFFNKPQLLFTLQFIKGPDDSITRMVAFGRDIWDKEKHLSLTPEQIRLFEGKYRFKDDPDDILQMTASGMNLVVRQMWDGKETIVSPRTDIFFYNEKQAYLVTFKKDDSGAVTGALILGNDYFEKMKN